MNFYKSKKGLSTKDVISAIAVVAVVILCMCIALIFDDDENESADEGLEEGVVYIQNFSVNYTTESESPNGSIDESSLNASKTAEKQQCYAVIDFGLQMATDNTDGETITMQLTVSNAYSVSSRINYADTSTTSLSTKSNITTITATWSLPADAGDISSERLIVALSPDAVGEAEISIEFSCKNKTPYVSSVIDGYVCVTEEQISLQNISPFEYSLSSDFSSYEIKSLVSSQYTEVEIKSQINGIPVTSIADNAFYGKSSLESVTIPNSITSIGSYAFYQCTALRSINIPKSLTNIGEYTFSGCSAITSLTIPDKVETIGDYAFYGCTSLTYLSLGSGLTYIGEYAFNSCTSLTNVTIPYKVDTIGKYAFIGCASLESVIFENAVGWYYKNLGHYDIDVTDVSTNAVNLSTSTWSTSYKAQYAWYRSD